MTPWTAIRTCTETSPQPQWQIIPVILPFCMLGVQVCASGAVQLGLLIVQRTAEELGCAIDMVTRTGKGTRFSVIIR